MPDISTTEVGSPTNIREFKLGIFNDVSAQQKGRVTRLNHPKFGTTYLIDITDREDPTTKDPGDKTANGEVIGEILKDEIEDPQSRDHYAMNNGIVSLITDRLDQNGQNRVYVGLAMTDQQDREAKEITTCILHDIGLQGGSFYVPFSFDSGLVKEYMAQEVMDAVRESGNKDLFSDFRSVAALSSPESH